MADEGFAPVEGVIDVCGTAYRFWQPPDLDALIDVAAFEADERIPYWANVWESAVVLAEELAQLDGRGRTLLELDSDLPLVRDATCCRSDGTLWAVAGDRAAQERPEGLWRIDAAFAGGRQMVRPACVARLAAPRAVACVTDSAVVVAHGDEGRTVIRYDLAARTTAAGEEKGP